MAGIDSDRTVRPARPLQRGVKVAETVARDIVRRIAAEGLRPGDRLPAEAQMLEDYGVGRSSLREALRILEIHGLITIKAGPGGGPVVAGVRTRDFGRMSTLYFQVGGMTFRELIEARLVMEPVLARLAAQRRDPELLEQLLIAGNSTEIDDDEAYLRTSSDFHWLVAQLARNGILSLYGHSLEDIFYDRITGLLFPYERRHQVSAAHSAIARAIEQGDAESAESLMREHMEEYAAYVIRRHPALIDEVVDWR